MLQKWYTLSLIDSCLMFKSSLSCLCLSDCRSSSTPMAFKLRPHSRWSPFRSGLRKSWWRYPYLINQTDQQTNLPDWSISVTVAPLDHWPVYQVTTQFGLTGTSLMSVNELFLHSLKDLHHGLNLNSALFIKLVWQKTLKIAFNVFSDI